MSYYEQTQGMLEICSSEFPTLTNFGNTLRQFSALIPITEFQNYEALFWDDTQTPLFSALPETVRLILDEDTQFVMQRYLTASIALGKLLDERLVPIESRFFHDFRCHIILIDLLLKSKNKNKELLSWIIMLCKTLWHNMLRIFWTLQLGNDDLIDDAYCIALYDFTNKNSRILWKDRD